MIISNNQVFLTKSEEDEFKKLFRVQSVPRDERRFNELVERVAQEWEAEGTSEGRLLGAVCRCCSTIEFMKSKKGIRRDFRKPTFLQKIWLRIMILKWKLIPDRSESQDSAVVD